MGVGPLRGCSTNYEITTAPNPDPSRWHLVRMEQFANAHVLKVRYKDCINFEGIKIMVYKGEYERKYRLDPHFDNCKDSPIARFKPTPEGWLMALALAQSI